MAKKGWRSEVVDIGYGVVLESPEGKVLVFARLYVLKTETYVLLCQAAFTLTLPTFRTVTHAARAEDDHFT